MAVEYKTMLKNIFILLLVYLLSNWAYGEKIKNHELYKIPKNEDWNVININKPNCHVCTYDIHIKAGSAQVNNVWIYGDFNFSLFDVKILKISGGSTVILGDSRPFVEIKKVHHK